MNTMRAYHRFKIFVNNSLPCLWVCLLYPCTCLLTDSTIYFNPHSNGLWLLPNESLGWPKPGSQYSSNLLLPKSKGEIVHMIKSALVPTDDDSSHISTVGHPNRMRVIGSGHSWSYVALSEGLQMSLHNYKVFPSWYCLSVTVNKCKQLLAEHCVGCVVVVLLPSSK